ncbi:hypothetical protein NPIL_304171 [Nephila pilipes]|uniref:Uncharacterized protein n=1 Tax=Nephila pilipes TaxID=299642 RepID=A0A8X6UDQ5_NEPPI|nr:hypothetical protein NPIL_304171 [Nephila pilipes]
MPARLRLDCRQVGKSLIHFRTTTQFSYQLQAILPCRLQISDLLFYTEECGVLPQHKQVSGEVASKVQAKQDCKQGSSKGVSKFLATKQAYKQGHKLACILLGHALSALKFCSKPESTWAVYELEALWNRPGQSTKS